MLIEISITNYLSFRDKTTISFLPSSKKNNKLGNNILKTTAIYGYNASGKTNFLQAISLIKELIINSHRFGPNELINIPGIRLQPFLLNTITQNKPSEFEIIFEINGIIYRYNFSLTNKEIIHENLFCKKGVREKTLFKREKQKIKIYDFDDNNSKNRVNENNLALSIFAKEGSIEAKEINKFFHDIYIFGKGYSFIDSENMLKTENITFKPFLIKMVRNADIGICDINFYTKKIPFKALPNSDDLARLMSNNGDYIPSEIDAGVWENYHYIYDDNGNQVGTVNLGIDAESDGTRKILGLAGSIYDVIRRGKILFIDEINESLHPALLNNLFLSINNIKSDKPYQFIFTSHNTHSMNIQKIFRRDQIRFTRKGVKGDSKFIRLSSISIRKDAIVEKNYFENKFGDNFEEKDDLLNE